MPRVKCIPRETAIAIGTMMCITYTVLCSIRWCELSYMLCLGPSMIMIGMLWVAVTNATTSMVVDSAYRHSNAYEVRRQGQSMELIASHGPT